MVNIKRVGSNSFGFLKRKVNEKRYEKRDKMYGEQYRKAFNIKQTHQERLVAERNAQRKEQSKKNFAERKRIIANIIGLNNKRKRRVIKHKKKGIRYREKVVTRYRYL